MTLNSTFQMCDEGIVRLQREDLIGHKCKDNTQFQENSKKTPRKLQENSKKVPRKTEYRFIRLHIYGIEEDENIYCWNLQMLLVILESDFKGKHCTHDHRISRYICIYTNIVKWKTTGCSHTTRHDMTTVGPMGTTSTSRTGSDSFWANCASALGNGSTGVSKVFKNALGLGLRLGELEEEVGVRDPGHPYPNPKP